MIAEKDTRDLGEVRARMTCCIHPNPEWQEFTYPAENSPRGEEILFIQFKTITIYNTHSLFFLFFLNSCV